MEDPSRFRRYVRRPVQVQFVVRDADDTGTGDLMFESLDLGAGGCFLRSDVLLDEGTRLDVTFTLPDTNTTIEARARVAWVTTARGADGEAGMGLEFYDLSEEEQKAISDFVKLHAQKLQVLSHTP